MRFPTSLPVLVFACLAPGPAPAPAAAQAHAHEAHAQASDSASVAEVVHAYHRALERADTAAVLELLADDVRVAESGGIETREEYLSHHLPGDMAFAAAVAREMGPLQVTVQGDVAWTVSSSTTRGTFRDREIDARGAELMVLSRQDGHWRIRAIHWSSRPAR